MEIILTVHLKMVMIIQNIILIIIHMVFQDMILKDIQVIDILIHIKCIYIIFIGDFVQIIQLHNLVLFHQVYFLFINILILIVMLLKLKIHVLKITMDFQLYLVVRIVIVILYLVIVVLIITHLNLMVRYITMQFGLKMIHLGQ